MSRILFGLMLAVCLSSSAFANPITFTFSGTITTFDVRSKIPGFTPTPLFPDPAIGDPFTGTAFFDPLGADSNVGWDFGYDVFASDGHAIVTAKGCFGCTTGVGTFLTPTDLFIKSNNVLNPSYGAVSWLRVDFLSLNFPSNTGSFWFRGEANNSTVFVDIGGTIDTIDGIDGKLPETASACWLTAIASVFMAVARQRERTSALASPEE